MRTRTSFQKRQKEIARAEKQRDKAAKRMQKKLMAKQPGDPSAETDDLGEPLEGPLDPATDSEPTI
jgi:hypothetical protein